LISLGNFLMLPEPKITLLGFAVYSNESIGIVRTFPE
jgi:hypothetical protein